MTNTSNTGNVECFISLDTVNERREENGLIETVLYYICCMLAFLERPAVKAVRCVVTFVCIAVFSFILLGALIGGSVSIPAGLAIAGGITLFGIAGFHGAD